MIIAAVFWLLTVVTVALFVRRAWRPSPAPSTDGAPASLGGGDRSRLVRSAVDAIVMLAIVRALFPPPGWGSWLWSVAVVAASLGVAGVIVGWRRHPAGRRRWTTIGYAVVGAGLVTVLA